MRKNELIWSLYQSDAYDLLYNRRRRIPMGVTQVWNPCPQIIDVDMALITKGFKPLGLAEWVVKTTDWEWVTENLLLYILLDGKGWVDVTRTPNGMSLMAVDVNMMQEVKYATDGSIAYARFTIETDDENTVTKTYTPTKTLYEWAKTQKKMAVPNVFGFIPLIEFTGMKSANEPISRLKNILDTLDLYNIYCYELFNIAKMHSDPVTFGNFQLDPKALKDKDVERKDVRSILNGETERSMRYVSIPDGASMSYLEMTGNIARLMAEEKDKIKKQIEMDYPELMLSTMMGGGSEQSGYALRIKLTVVDSIITRYRKNYAESLRKVFWTALTMMGLPDYFDFTFEDVVSDDPTDLLERIVLAYTNNLVQADEVVDKVAELLGVVRKEKSEDVGDESHAGRGREDTIGKESVPSKVA